MNEVIDKIQDLIDNAQTEKEFKEKLDSLTLDDLIYYSLIRDIVNQNKYEKKYKYGVEENKPNSFFNVLFGLDK